MDNDGLLFSPTQISASKPSYEVGTSTRLPGVRKLAGMQGMRG